MFALFAVVWKGNRSDCSYVILSSDMKAVWFYGHNFRDFLVTKLS